MNERELQQEAAAFLAGMSQERIKIIEASTPRDDEARMASDVLSGLGRAEHKSLPSMYLYDALGFALYQQATSQPEYYLSQAETALLQTVIAETPDWFETLLFPAASDCQLVELGSGTARKTRLLLDAWFAQSQRARTEKRTYIPVDVSASTLNETVAALGDEYPQLRILGLMGEYEDSLSVLPPHPARLALFLGATIGNFTTEAEQADFFLNLRRWLGPGTRLLLGYDQRPNAKKSQAVIERAYNDSQGCVAAFNLNILNHVNRRLSADFDLSCWQARQVYNETCDQIEFYVESRQAQRVHIAALSREFAFEAGERILTLVSRKFDPAGLIRRFKTAGYTTLHQWSDADEHFGLLLLET